jgi:glyoxylase-like metal-dependent hydrolase (beta-lactamase superfamily II)
MNPEHLSSGAADAAPEAQPTVAVATVGPFQENCYVLVDAGELAVFDPGDEPDRLIALVEELAARHGARLRYLVLTHAHLDHVGAAKALQDRFGAPVVMARAEAPLLEMLPLQYQLFGLPAQEAPRVDRLIEGGEALPFGRGALEAIPTPGHTAGGTSFRYGDHVFVGDTIFAGGVGRTDLWGGSWPTLERSITQNLFTLPEHLTLYPGHGPTTTVGEEKRSNPFFT